MSICRGTPSPHPRVGPLSPSPRRGPAPPAPPTPPKPQRETRMQPRPLTVPPVQYVHGCLGQSVGRYAQQQRATYVEVSAKTGASRRSLCVRSCARARAFVWWCVLADSLESAFFPCVERCTTIYAYWLDALVIPVVMAYALRHRAIVLQGMPWAPEYLTCRHLPAVAPRRVPKSCRVFVCLVLSHASARPPSRDRLYRLYRP